MQVLLGDGNESEFYRDQVFLGCDDHAVTCQELIDLCNKSGVYEGEVDFYGMAKMRRRTVNTDWTRSQLDWKPKYDSFESFVMDHKGQDIFSEWSGVANQ